MLCSSHSYMKLDCRVHIELINKYGAVIRSPKYKFFLVLCAPADDRNNEGTTISWETKKCFRILFLSSLILQGFNYLRKEFHPVTSASKHKVCPKRQSATELKSDAPQWSPTILPSLKMFSHFSVLRWCSRFSHCDVTQRYATTTTVLQYSRTSLLRFWGNRDKKTYYPGKCINRESYYASILPFETMYHIYVHSTHHPPPTALITFFHIKRGQVYNVRGWY